MRKKGKDVCYRKTLNLPRGRREAKLESGQVGMDLAARGSGASADSSAEPERAQSSACLILSTSHSPSSPRAGASCFHLRQDHLPWQGAQQSFLTAKGSERAAGDSLGDQLMESSTAFHDLVKTGRGGIRVSRGSHFNCCPFWGVDKMVEG